MKRTIPELFAIAVALAVVSLVPAAKRQMTTLPVVHAQSGCSNATLTGNYAAIQPAGFTTPGRSLKGAAVPWQVVGTFTLDGAGNVSASYTAAVNGTDYTSQTASGSYTVNSDCTASLSFTSGDAAGYAADLAIIRSGAELFGIAAGNGDTASFDAKKQ
jgi:hypothetical protein